MVDAIVEAAARILATGGAAGFSTNQVAQAAGVGIGSLYQYFPDKHAIVEAIRRQHLDEVLAALRAASACRGAPRTCAETLVAVHAGKPGLHRALLELAPAHAAGAQAADGFEQAYADAYVEVVKALRGRQSATRAQAMALVLSGAVEGAIHAAARAGLVASAAFRRQLVDLVMAYLVRERKPATR